MTGKWRSIAPSMMIAGVLLSCASSGSDESSSEDLFTCWARHGYAEHFHTVLDIPPYETEIEGAAGPSLQKDVADPHVIRVGDTWYLYPTGPTFYEVWSSTDLIEWKREGKIWEPTPGSWNELGREGQFGAWAPAVWQRPEGFYLYYTADVRLGVAFSESPTGPFEEVYDQAFIGNGYGGVGDGIVAGDIADYQEFAIDAMALETSAGELYLYATAYYPIATIVGWQLIDPVTLASDEPTIVLPSNPESWELVVNEGAFVTEYEGRFHLTYSGNYFPTPDYAVGGAISDHPLGPYERYPHNPIFSQMPERGIIGPGHHSLVEGLCGETLIFYHSKQSTDVASNRRIRFGPAQFNEQGYLEILFPGDEPSGNE